MEHVLIYVAVHLILFYPDTVANHLHGVLERTISFAIDQAATRKVLLIVVSNPEIGFLHVFELVVFASLVSIHGLWNGEHGASLFIVP